MKCLVFSDSHNEDIYMKHAMMKHRDAEAVFFLGDGVMDFDYAMSYSYNAAAFKVRGNCDSLSHLVDNNAAITDLVNLNGYKIVYTHGHMYNAKIGIGDLIALAISRDADIVLFGHTHVPLELYIDIENEEYLRVLAILRQSDMLPADFVPRPIYLFNPGSISYHSNVGPSYGIMTLTENSVLFSHGRER